MGDPNSSQAGEGRHTIAGGEATELTDVRRRFWIAPLWTPLRPAADSTGRAGSRPRALARGTVRLRTVPR